MKKLKVYRDENNVPYMDINDALQFKGCASFPTIEIECAVFNTLKRICRKAENQISKSVFCSKTDGTPLPPEDADVVRKANRPPKLNYEYIYYFSGGPYTESYTLVR